MDIQIVVDLKCAGPMALSAISLGQAVLLVVRKTAESGETPLMEQPAP